MTAAAIGGVDLPSTVSARQARGPIVTDTDVYGADWVGSSNLAAAYEPVVVGRLAFISFQTAAELRYGAIRRNWGPARMLALEGKIGEAETVHSGLNSSSSTPSSARTANASVMRSVSDSTTLIAGLPRRRCASASRSSPTTASSKACPE